MTVHITHLEDLIFCGESDLVFAILKEFDNQFTIGKSALNITTKFDGSPAIVCGTNNAGFFVGTKAVFNKIPKACYTENDIWNHYGEVAKIVYYTIN